MKIICREVDKNSGKIAVYGIDAEVTDSLIQMLEMRARLNPDLRYFAVPLIRWNTESIRKDIVSALKRKSSIEQSIERLGGIVEL